MTIKSRLADAAAGKVIAMAYSTFDSDEKKKENEKRWNGKNNSKLLIDAFKKMNEEELTVIEHYFSRINFDSEEQERESLSIREKPTNILIILGQIIIFVTFVIMLLSKFL